MTGQKIPAGTTRKRQRERERILGRERAGGRALVTVYLREQVQTSSGMRGPGTAALPPGEAAALIGARTAIPA